MEVEADTQSMQYSTSAQVGSQRPKRKRIRNWTAEDRAVHREFEKSRREAFSERLTELTKLLPMLKNEQRPSKHIIVDASISHHKDQEARCLQAAHTIQALLAEREDLLREVNALRSLGHPGTCMPRQARPIDLGVLEMLAGQKELVADPVVRPEEPLEDVSSALMPTVSVSTSAPNQISQPPGPALLNGERPSAAHNSGVWVWGHNNAKATLSTALPINTGDESSTLWSQSPGVLTQTPPKDAELGYDANVSHLIDDAALFWTQHPGLLNTTPPRDHDLPFDTHLSDVTGDPSLLWASDLPITTTAPQMNDELNASQNLFHSANIFSNQGSLSL